MIYGFVFFIKKYCVEFQISLFFIDGSFFLNYLINGVCVKLFQDMEALPSVVIRGILFVLFIDVIKQLLFMLLLTNNTSVINISTPELRWVGCCAESFILEELHEQVRENWRERGSHGHAKGLLIDLAVVLEVGGFDDHGQKFTELLWGHLGTLIPGGVISGPLDCHLDDFIARYTSEQRCDIKRGEDFSFLNLNLFQLLH